MLAFRELGSSELVGVTTEPRPQFKTLWLIETENMMKAGVTTCSEMAPVVSEAVGLETWGLFGVRYLMVVEAFEVFDPAE